MKPFKDTPVQDLMMRDVLTVSPSTSLLSAGQTMLKHEITCLIVDLNDPTRGLGIVTQKDVIGHLFDDIIEVNGATVEDVMTHPTIVLSPDWSLETAVSLMRMMGVRRAPVVEAAKLVGLLSFTDVFRHALLAQT
ncbi:MAG: CBS domain-containing protein [Candidatus Paceibacteria bacterium]|jgi:CBS domain-containing protein